MPINEIIQNEDISSEVNEDNIEKTENSNEKSDVLLLQKKYRSGEINEVDLTVKEDIKKCNLFELYWKHLKNIISGNISFN